MSRAIAQAAIAALMLGGVAIAADRPDKRARETEWSGYLAPKVAGQTEYPLPNGDRVDILSHDTAWEVERCRKQDQAFGQAIRYAAATGRQPGVWLLFVAGDDEDYLRALVTLQYLRRYGVPIKFRVEVIDQEPQRDIGGR